MSVLTPQQQAAYFASEQNKPTPLSPEQWLAQQNKTLPSLPVGGGATQPTLPENSGTQSPLLSFASSLDAAASLARTHRNQSSLDMMAPYRGTVGASDFNSILSNLNHASDSTSADLIKRATESSTLKSDTVTIGGDLYQVQKDATGNIVGKPVLILKAPTKVTDSNVSAEDLKQFINKQIASPDFQGLSDPDKTLYIQSQGGTPSDFGF